MNHPVHPKCGGCGKSLYKSFEKGKAVKKTDPWNFCRNHACKFSGPAGVGEAEVVVEKTKREPEVYGAEYAAIIDADRGKIQPVRSSALGLLIQQNDFAITLKGERPYAGVGEPKSVPSREVFFWKHKGQQVSTHVSKFTPNWCGEHRLAFDGEICPSKKHTKTAKTRVGVEHPAITKAREQLEPLVKKLAPSDAPPASIGLVMALLNQMTGSKEAANLLIDEYELDKKFGLQKF